MLIEGDLHLSILKGGAGTPLKCVMRTGISHNYFVIYIHLIWRLRKALFYHFLVSLFINYLLDDMLVYLVKEVRNACFQNFVLNHVRVHTLEYDT